MAKDIKTRKLEYRRRKIEVLIKKIGLAVILLAFLIFFVFYTSSANKGTRLDPTEFITVHFSGYEGAGNADIEVDRKLIAEKMNEAYNKYESALWPFIKDCTLDDFVALGESFECILDKDSDLKNDDKLTISVKLDEELSKKLEIVILHEELPVEVNGLEPGIDYPDENFFKDISVSMNGVSPVVQIEIINDSADKFLQSVDYTIEPDKEFFSNGDKFKIRANYDEDTARKLHYAVEGKNLEREYTVEGSKGYVVSANQISAEVLESAINKGITYFTNANEYGLRIFTEAGLVYTWKGTDQYTFEWSNVRILSSYFQHVKDEYRGDISKPYNYLELV